MNKVLSLLFTMFVGMAAWATDITITPSDFAEATSSDFSTTKDGVTIAVEGSTVTADQIRIFKGKTITITSSVGDITKIVFTCTASDDAKYGPGCFNAQDGYSYEGKAGTWTGSAAEVAFTAETNQVRATEIVVTISDGSSSETKAATRIVFADGYETKATCGKDESVKLPIATVMADSAAVEGAAVTWSLSGDSLAQLDGDVLKIFNGVQGTVDVKAEYAGDDSHFPCSKTYTLTIYKGYMLLSSIIDDVTSSNPKWDNGGEYASYWFVNEDFKPIPNIVTYANGRYIYLTNGTENLLFYGINTQDLKQGDVISGALDNGQLGAVWGKLYRYNNLPEFAFTDMDVQIQDSVTVVPKTITVDQLGDNINAYVEIENAKLVSTDNKKNLTFNAGETEFLVYNQFNVPIEALEEGATYTLTGLGSIFKTTTQLYLTSFVKTGEVVIIDPQPQDTIHIANSAETAYTVAEAIRLIEAGQALDETVYVKGIVSQVDAFNEKYGSITYWISVDGTTESQHLECYNGLGFDGVPFKTIDDVEVGAEVIVKGNLTKYKDIYEFNRNNELVSYIAPVYPPVADGTYYLYSVAAKGYLVGANSWGTHASISKVGGLEIKVYQADGKYELNTSSLYPGKRLGFNGYVDDGNNQNWTIVPVEGQDGVFTLATDDGTVLFWEGDGTTLASVGVPADEENAYWRFISSADRMAALANATAQNPVDATFLISNPNFGRSASTSAWTMEASNKNLSGGNNENNCAESWHSVFTLSQTLANAPKGLYALTAQGFYRNDSEDTEYLPYFYANGETRTFPYKTGSENSMKDASESFTAGLYTIEPIYVTVGDSTGLTIGAKLENNISLWCIWDNFQLTYYGKNAIIDIEPEVEVPEGWVSMISNGNLEGGDIYSFYSKEAPITDYYPAAIVPGAGVNGSRGIVVKSAENPEQAWDTQFWIRMNEPLQEGTKLHVEFDYRSTQEARTTTQMHGEPGYYHHYIGIGDVYFVPEWQHYVADVEVTSAMASSEGLLSIAFNLSEEQTATEYHFDNFAVWAKMPEPVEEWVDIMVNGDMEGESTECFYVTEQGLGGPYLAEITDGIGKNRSRAIMVQSQDSPNNSWDTQFFIRLPYQLPAGTPFRVTFDVKANKAAYFSTETHSEPSGYIYWGAIGSYGVDVWWETYEVEGVVTSDMSNEKNMMQTIAFDLAESSDATQYIFDNIKFEVPASVLDSLILNPAEDPRPYPAGRMGDVNTDREINITDVVLIIEDILQREPQNYNAELADVNKDGYIDVSDVVMVIDAILGKVELSRGAELIDRSAYTAFQMDLTIPAGYVLESVTLTEIAKNSHSLAYAMLPDGRCRVVVCSMNNEALPGAWDEVISLNLRGKGDAQVNIDRAVFVTIDGERHELMMNPTSIAQISNLKSQASNLYDLQGRKIEKSVKGILIENGKKTIRK